MPKKHRKNEDNSLPPPKKNQDLDNPGQKSLGQYCNTHIFLSFLGFLLKQCISFEFSGSSPSPTLYKVETRKKFWIHESNIVCGGRGGEGLELYELENTSETQKCPKNFVHDCSYKVWHFKLVSLWCGRTDGRTVTWLPEFLGWIDYKHFLDMGPSRVRSALVDLC